LAARQLAQGNYQAQIPLSSKDEIGDLTNSFATMRTTIRENEQSLIASRDEAHRAVEAKSRFLATMSHEIRTPLNGVIPIAELLLEQELPKEQAQLIETIQESGKALKSIIDDILDITKLDEGKFIIRHEEFALENLVRNVVNMFRISAQNKGISLEAVIPKECPEIVVGDADRLRQVLINLVGNAIKFTSKGEVALRVCFNQEQKSDYHTVRFEVSDTGIGISEQDQDHVFDRFVQVDNRSNREYQGTGLGLSICNLLVAAMGGKLSVESREGMGSRFHFSLSFEQVNFDEHAEKENPVKDLPVAPGCNQSSVEASNILVVDDSKANLKIATVILQSLDHSVTTADSGSDALNLMKMQKFNLILMDVNMPGIDGLETTRRIRNDPMQTAHTPILGLSASAFAEDIQSCLNAGMDGFLAKPISKSELVTALAEHL